MQYLSFESILTKVFIFKIKTYQITILSVYCNFFSAIDKYPKIKLDFGLPKEFVTKKELIYKEIQILFLQIVMKVSVVYAHRRKFSLN